MPTPAMETMAHAARQALTSATARATTSAVVCMLAAAGCNGPGRALGEDQRPADDLTDEELIERCATASPDEEGLGCPDGCVTVDLRDGNGKTVSICGGGGGDDVVQVCAPTRGAPVVQGVEVLHPDYPTRVAFTHGCMDSALTWLPIGWERCAGDETDPIECQCSLDESGELIVKEVFFSLVECAGVSSMCGSGGNLLDVPLEDEICIWSGLRDRTPGLYTFQLDPITSTPYERFLLVTDDSDGTVFNFVNQGPPILGGSWEHTPEKECDAAGHGLTRLITQCQLAAPEAFQSCIDEEQCPSGFSLQSNCVAVLDPYTLCDAFGGGRGGG